MSPLFSKVLVANRGEIALRIIRTCRTLGIRTVAVYADPDRQALHARLSDEAYPLDGSWAEETYLNQEKLLALAQQSGAEAIHPGYGFLSEDPSFAEACAQRKLTFIGPSAQAMRLAGDKRRAKLLACSLGISIAPGSLEPWESVRELVAIADGLGYPLYLKPSAYSGGGRGIHLIHDSGQIISALGLTPGKPLPPSAKNYYMEKAIRRAKHVEVQFLADNEGRVLCLGERECTIQRRHQKLIEESPCTVLEAEPAIRAQMFKATVALVRAAGFTGTGTAEFLLDRQGNFFFMELNPRLQVEHGVTEMVTGLDLVREQLRLAAGRPLRYEVVTPRGAAIECRICAEDPRQNFMPSPGLITSLHEPGGCGVRVDSALYPDMEVSPYYDSLLAKVIVWGETRSEALRRAQQALTEYRIEGIKHTIPYTLAVLASPDFVSGKYDYSLNGNVVF